jgi:hypothetical protein
MKKLATSVILACLNLLLIGVYFLARVAHPLTEAQILGGWRTLWREHKSGVAHPLRSLQRVGLPRLSPLKFYAAGRILRTGSGHRFTLTLPCSWKA